jgi:hypothetical protein
MHQPSQDLRISHIDSLSYNQLVLLLFLLSIQCRMLFQAVLVFGLQAHQYTTSNRIQVLFLMYHHLSSLHCNINNSVSLMYSQSNLQRKVGSPCLTIFSIKHQESRRNRRRKQLKDKFNTLSTQVYLVSNKRHMHLTFRLLVI